MRRLAVIPARGGSKRIPRKNIKPFCGKPIIAWSIEAALASNCFERIIVSTDDQEIAAVARHWGAEVPFLRPAQLADDYCGTQAVVKHAIAHFAEQTEVFDQVCCLYATAPFLTPQTVSGGCELLSHHTCDYVVTVTSFSFPIQRALFVNQQAQLEPFYPSEMLQRSQDLTRAYHDAGQMYWGLPDAFMDDTNLWSKRVMPMFLAELQVQDIDTEEDWILAETKFQLMLKKMQVMP